MHKITIDDGSWVNLREPNERMKAGERRMLYEMADKLEGGQASVSLQLMRHVAAHLIRDWSLDAPHPRVVWKDGRPDSYEHVESLDELDCEMENEILLVAKEWMDKITLSFKPSRDPASPTDASGS